jgi:hypothetical protein
MPTNFSRAITGLFTGELLFRPKYLFADRSGIYRSLFSWSSNVLNWRGRAPLHVAVQRAAVDVVKALLDLGAGTPIAAISGHHLASARGNEEIIALFVHLMAERGR